MAYLTTVHNVENCYCYILLVYSCKDWGQEEKGTTDWGQEGKGTTEDEMVGWHHQLKGHEFG